jgi:hypothetical protein
MLGLGNSVTSVSGYSSFSPDSIPNLTLWLASNRHITANQDEDNNTVSHSTSAGTMENEDQINRWGAFAGTTIDAIQNNQPDKPKWSTVAADVGAVNFKASLKFMDIDTQINCAGACSFVFRLKPTDLSAVRAIMGSTNTEFLQFQSASQFRIKVDNNQVNFTEASNTIATNKYTIIVLTRNSSDEWNLYAKTDGGTYATEEQWGTADQTQAGTFTITNLGCKSDDSANFNGFMKDVLIYNGTALNANQRADLYDYIHSQEN